MLAFDVTAFLDIIERERIQSLIGVPTVFALAVAHPRLNEVDISSVQSVGFGGAAATPEIIGGIRRARLLHRGGGGDRHSGGCAGGGRGGCARPGHG
ncbi:hypothetical protein AB0F49_28055 [Micromonospora ureilytica]|uniref:hypothetical protein n=1 Tax=Micromonospora ureilytica TaxID=709868 RepID=UPI0033CDC036